MGEVSEIAVTQPHAVYTALTHVFLHLGHKLLGLSTELFYPLDDVLSLIFLPALTGQPAFNESFFFCLFAMGGTVSLIQLFAFILPLVILHPL